MMTAENIVKDISELYTRLFDHRPFLSGEIKYFQREFEESRGDREVENLFTAVQNSIEIKTTAFERCRVSSETHLPVLKITLEEALTACEKTTNRQPDPQLLETLNKHREERKKVWQIFIDDLAYKCSRVDHTFEEKEEELREFYSDLEQKLHIHK